MRKKLCYRGQHRAFASTVAVDQTIQEYPVPKGVQPHDIAPAAEGGVWYTTPGRTRLAGP
jgi:streptogramin lyase